jgi:hypothetical protein
LFTKYFGFRISIPTCKNRVAGIKAVILLLGKYNTTFNDKEYSDKKLFINFIWRSIYALWKY